MEKKDSFQKLGIGAGLIGALLEAGIKTPMAIQEMAIPKILSGEHLIGKAPTGTGKTLAYLLPVMERLNGDFAEAIILGPTPELAMQIARVASDLAQKAKLTIRAMGLITGANLSRQAEKLKTKPTLITGTPKRLNELSRMGKLKTSKSRFLVLDEFDRLLDDQQQEETVNFIKSLPIEKMQVLCFSATAPQKIIDKVSFLKDFELVEVKEQSVGLREDCFVLAPFREKLDRLKRLTHRLPIKKGLVFFNEKNHLSRAAEKLAYEKIAVGVLSGGEDKLERKNSVAAFAAGKTTLLLATDLAARGLDFEDVDTVINMGSPESPHAYLHRAGRTARAGKKGRVLTIIDPKEKEKFMTLAKKLEIEIFPLR